MVPTVVVMAATLGAPSGVVVPVSSHRGGTLVVVDSCPWSWGRAPAYLNQMRWYSRLWGWRNSARSTTVNNRLMVMLNSCSVTKIRR